LALVLLVATAAMAPAAPASAEGALSGAPPVLQRTLWREGRVEVLPKFSFTMGDTYEHNLLPGVGVNYFVLDWLGVGVDLEYGISVDTSLHEDIDRELRAKRNAICPEILGAQRAECLAALGVTEKMGTASLEFMATAQVSFVPISGKFKIWNQLIHYDTHVLVGGVFALVRGENGMDGGIAFGPSVGIGARFHFNEWVGVVLQVRDFLLDYHAGTDQRGTDLPSQFHNHVSFSAGLSLSFPRVPRVEPVGFE
jgi:outer membrane beta-barrel protein